MSGWCTGVVVLLASFSLGLGCRSGAGAPAIDAGEPDALAACVRSDASYTACGCGCCPGAPSSMRCLARGETLDSVAQADRAAASSPGCAQTGCAAPIIYTCCQ